MISAPRGAYVRIDGLAAGEVPVRSREMRRADGAAAFYGEVFEPVTLPEPADDGDGPVAAGRCLLIAGQGSASETIRAAFARRGGAVDLRCPPDPTCASEAATSS